MPMVALSYPSSNRRREAAIPGEDHGQLAVLPAGRLYPENGIMDLRRVELAGMSQGDGQVKGPHEDTVHAVHGADLLDVGQTAGGLALGQQQRLPVAPVI